MVFKTLLIVLVFAVLMEDSLSIKKTAEEEKEDREIAEKVNATLADEAEKKKEEEDENEAKKKKGVKKEDVEGQDEACPPANVSCPIVEPCPPCPEVKECETCKTCEPCKVCKECGQCPTVKPCFCPGNNSNNRTGPAVPDGCPESVSAIMTVPVAIAVGAVASLVVTGVVATLGLLLRYAPPLVSGFLFLFLVVLTWYLSSHYPETARDLGGRVVATLREAAVALGHRVVEAIQRHNEQVGFPSKPVFLLE
jgi:hypothetical protein